MSTEQVLNFTIVDNGNQPTHKNDFIRASRRKVEAGLTMFQFIDNDTKQIVCIVPSLDLSGYGETEEKAIEMIKFSLNDFFTSFLAEMPYNHKRDYLNSQGWKQNTLKNKEFSKSYVDGDGNLKNFNAENNKVSRLTLVSV